MYSFLYLKTKLLHCFSSESYGELSELSKVQLTTFLTFLYSPEKDLCLENILFDFVFVHNRRRETNFLTVKYGLDGSVSSGTDIGKTLGKVYQIQFYAFL